ncbi:tumor protein p53-inducible nuclear protein 1 [Osmerus mordax]|uniref:tumor protein p53-inducible nuclear protein 1 n=1 Tax=Osmerus mordax TaxID=8014 RepID=UPI003510B2F9
MFQRFASVLFGDDVEEVSHHWPGEQGFGQPEGDDDEEWILVDYLAEACSDPCGEDTSSVPDQEDDDEEDLVMIPSPVASSPALCASFDSTSEADPDRGLEAGEGGFLHVEPCSLEESWFVTPPPCFTGRGSKPILLETSPLENLLIEHPSMSVYAAARHLSPQRLSLKLPCSLNLSLDLTLPPANAAATGKETGRRTMDTTRHRPDVAVVQCHASLHTTCYAAALSARSSLLDQVQQAGRLAQRAQPLSRNAMRRLNLLRQPGGGRQSKATAMYLHQPGQRHLNY